MNFIKIFMGLNGELAFLAMVCLVIILAIIVLTIAKKMKDK